MVVNGDPDVLIIVAHYGTLESKLVLQCVFSWSPSVGGGAHVVKFGGTTYIASLIITKSVDAAN